MKSLILGILFIIVSFATANNIYAQCSCANAGGSTYKEFKRSKIVFVGEVIEVKKIKNVENTEYSEFDVTFKVKIAWKTDSTENITIRNIDSDNSDFKLNESYLVYAQIHNDKLTAYIGCCSRTKKLSDAEKDLEVLRKEGEKPIEKKDLSSSETKPNK